MNGLRVCVVKSPGFGFKRVEYLQDIAVLTKATVFSDQLGSRIGSFKAEDLGVCDKITISRSGTIISGSTNDKDVISRHVNSIKALIDGCDDDYELQRLRERLSKLSGGVAVIYVGASSDTEVKEKIDRIDDALCATKAALDEGILPGGGMAYYNCLKGLDAVTNGDVVVYESMLSPIGLIMSNAGLNPDEVITDGFIGYNAKTNKFEDLKLAGVVDPTKVAISALENAASITGMVLLTECAIIN